MTDLDRFALADENLRITGIIKRAVAHLWPSIKAIKNKEDRENEIGLVQIIKNKIEELTRANQTFLYRDHLRDLDLANNNLALALDIMDTTERLWPTIKQMRDPIVNANLLDIVQSANNLWVINRAYAQKKADGRAAVDEAIDIMNAAPDGE